MQATTIETYVVAAVIETAVGRALANTLGDKEMARLGFEGPPGVAAKLGEFGGVLDGRAALPAIAALTDSRIRPLTRAGRFSTYLSRPRPDHRLHRQHRAEPPPLFPPDSSD